MRVFAFGRILAIPREGTRREAVGACCLFPANKDADGGDT